MTAPVLGATPPQRAAGRKGSKPSLRAIEGGASAQRGGRGPRTAPGQHSHYDRRSFENIVASGRRPAVREAGPERALCRRCWPLGRRGGERLAERVGNQIVDRIARWHERGEAGRCS
eukprot:scaffold23810_cov131-Isochrysis_galbana.AAC.1